MSGTPHAGSPLAARRHRPGRSAVALWALLIPCFACGPQDMPNGLGRDREALSDLAGGASGTLAAGGAGGLGESTTTTPAASSACATVPDYVGHCPQWVPLKIQCGFSSTIPPGCRNSREDWATTEISTWCCPVGTTLDDASPASSPSSPTSPTVSCTCQAPGNPAIGKCACSGTLHLLDQYPTVLTNPKVYVDWWGWGSPPNDPSGEIPVLEDYLHNLGGSRWLNTVTQYSATNGSCGNPTDLWGGEWFGSTNPLPVGTSGSPCTKNGDCASNLCNVSSGKCYPTRAQLVTEQTAAINHFQLQNLDAMILIAMPPAVPNPGYAEHASSSSVVYIEFPYNSAAAPTAMHEIAEAITDPRWDEVGGAAWNDDCGCELADLCPDTGLSVGESPTANYEVVGLVSNAANQYPPACVHAFSTHEDYYFIGSNGNLKHTTSLVGNNTIDDYGHPSGVTITSTPGAVSWRNGRQDAFVYGSDGNVWQWRQGNGVTPAWYSWGHPTGTLQFSPDAFSWRPNREDVVVVASNASGVFEFWKKAYSNGTWLGWTDLGAPPTSAIASRPGTASWGPNRFDIFFLTTESPPHVRHAYSTNGSSISGWDDWSYQSGVTFGTGVDAASWGDQRVDVVVTSTDGNVWQRGWDHNSFSGWFSWGNPGPGFSSRPGAVGLGDFRLEAAATNYTPGSQAWRRVWDWGGFPAWSDDSQYENTIDIDISAW